MFKVIKYEGKARRGKFKCAHGGEVQTPVFMNVGTQAAIKGGGMMRLSSVWMGAGGSGVFSLRCRIGRSAKAMRRCALRRCSCGSARCRRTASEAGRIVFSRDYALWISRLQSGGADPSAPEIERASGRNDPSRAKCRTPCAALLQQCVSGRGAFPVCSRGTSLPPGRTRFGSLVFLLFFVARKLN